MENQMDLTLGGNSPSLSEDILRFDEARDPLWRRRQPPRPVPQPQPGPPQVDPPPEPILAEPPPPEPTPRLRVVTLEDGDTLWGLATTHLGAGSRWRELVRLNGWSEERAARLPAGTQVKLPRD